MNHPLSDTNCPTVSSDGNTVTVTSPESMTSDIDNGPMTSQPGLIVAVAAVIIVLLGILIALVVIMLLVKKRYYSTGAYIENN